MDAFNAKATLKSVATAAWEPTKIHFASGLRDNQIDEIW
jgi:hypothetical protein